MGKGLRKACKGVSWVVILVTSTHIAGQLQGWQWESCGEMNEFSKVLGGLFENGGFLLRKMKVKQIGTSPLAAQCICVSSIICTGSFER